MMQYFLLSFSFFMNIFYCTLQALSRAQMDWPAAPNTTLPRPGRIWNSQDLGASNGTLAFPGVNGTLLRLDPADEAEGTIFVRFIAVERGKNFMPNSCVRSKNLNKAGSNHSFLH